MSNSVSLSAGQGSLAGPLIPIRRLRNGQTAAVRQLVGQPQQVQRLRELGFRDGAEIRMVRSGSPCIVRLGTKDLCFRAAEVLGVLVQIGVTG